MALASGQDLSRVGGESKPLCQGIPLSAIPPWTLPSPQSVTDPSRSIFQNLKGCKMLENFTDHVRSMRESNVASGICYSVWSQVFFLKNQVVKVSPGGEASLSGGRGG